MFDECSWEVRRVAIKEQETLFTLSNFGFGVFVKPSEPVHCYLTIHPPFTRSAVSDWHQGKCGESRMVSWLMNSCCSNRIILMPFLQKILTLENHNWGYSCAIGTDGCHYGNISLVAITLCFLSFTSSGRNNSCLFATAKWKPTFIKPVEVVWLDVAAGVTVFAQI